MYRLRSETCLSLDAFEESVGSVGFGVLSAILRSTGVVLMLKDVEKLANVVEELTDAVDDVLGDSMYGI